MLQEICWLSFNLYSELINNKVDYETIDFFARKFDPMFNMRVINALDEHMNGKYDQSINAGLLAVKFS